MDSAGGKVIMRLGRLFGSLVFAALAVTSASAQATGGLKVRVIDNSDKTAVIGAAVTLSNTNKLVATSTLITDVNGIALFPVLRVGAGYVITVIMDGYAGIRQDANVSGGSQKEIVIAMAPEHVERVTVIGEKTQVDLDQNQASTKFSSDFIQDLPVAGRFYQNVLSLAPGVQDPDGDGNPNVNGARERDFKTSVGGISNVDPLTGQFLNLVTSDSIEDLTVVTAGAGAEYGRAQGGFAQIIQKQGSNDFEGVFGLLYSSSKLDGNGSTGIPNSLVPDFFLYQPSLQVSGPIVKDKLWYRLSEEVIDREDPVVLATGGTIATQGTQQLSTDNQLTWQVSNRNKLALIFRADPRTTTNVGVSPLVPVASTEEFQFGGPTYTLTWTAPYSPSLLVDSTFAYQNTHLNITPTQSGVANDCTAPAYLAGAQCFNVLDGTVSGSSPRTWEDSRQRLTLKSDATYFKGRLWGASHQFKFGLVIENERYFRSLDRNPTFVEFSSFDANTDQVGRFYNVTASLEPSSRQTAVGTTWGIYGEDVIRPLPNLSITVGLRLEQEDVSSQGFVPFDPYSESNAYIADTAGLDPSQRVVYLQRAFIGYEDLPGSLNAVAAQFPLARFEGTAYTAQLSNWQKFRQPDDVNLNNTNIAPRISVAWDPWNDGKTKFSGSWGRYYDKIFLAVPAAESEPVLVNFQTREIARVAYAPTFSYTTVDRNLKTPYQDEWSLSFERDIWQESSISLRYIHRSFQKQLQDIDINQIPGDYGRCLIAQGTSDPTLAESPGVGTVIDPYTGQPYEDTDPGIGDGRLDDCIGESVFANGGTGDGNGTSSPTVPRADGVPDLYVLNPGWGNIFQIGNYNTAQYDGVILEFVRRQYKNWQMEASYTWSKATGNGEDYSLILGDDRSTLADEKGYQSYDVRHALKVNATAIVAGGIRLGGTVQWQTGLPYSILLRRTAAASALPYYNIGNTFYSVRTAYPTHQRNDQRNAAAWNFDAKLVKEFNLPKGMNLQLTAEIFNLFGENTYVVYNQFTKSGQQVNGTNDATRRFGRQYQLGMRLAF
jgi:hypothetical protein